MKETEGRSAEMEVGHRYGAVLTENLHIHFSTPAFPWQIEVRKWGWTRCGGETNEEDKCDVRHFTEHKAQTQTRV